MDLKKEINELEKRAKEGDYYKERYETLRDEVKNSLKNLSEILGEKIEKKVLRVETKKTDNRFVAVAEEIYKDLKIDDTKEITREKTAPYLAKQGQSENIVYQCKVTDILKTMPGIQIRKVGNTRFYYYSDVMAKEKEFKFDKVSFMG